VPCAHFTRKDYALRVKITRPSQSGDVTLLTTINGVPTSCSTTYNGANPAYYPWWVDFILKDTNFPQASVKMTALTGKTTLATKEPTAKPTAKPTARPTAECLKPGTVCVHASTAPWSCQCDFCCFTAKVKQSEPFWLCGSPPTRDPYYFLSHL
jgi:hypothetical protein